MISTYSKSVLILKEVNSTDGGRELLFLQFINIFCLSIVLSGEHCYLDLTFVWQFRNVSFWRKLDILNVQCVRETLHVFDFNLKDNALRYFDAVFCSLKFHLSDFTKYLIR